MKNLFFPILLAAIFAASNTCPAASSPRNDATNVRKRVVALDAAKFAVVPAGDAAKGNAPASKLKVMSYFKAGVIDAANIQRAIDVTKGAKGANKAQPHESAIAVSSKVAVARDAAKVTRRLCLA